MHARTRHLYRAAAALAVIVALFVALTAAAGAQSDATLLLRRFEGGGARAGRHNTVDFVWTGADSEVANLKVTENGSPVALQGKPTPLRGVDIGIVFVIDSGGGMDTKNVLTSTREAVIKFTEEHPGLHYAVVQAGDQADIKTDFTTDADRIKTVVSSIGATKGSSVWQALNLAGNLYTEQSRFQRNVMLITADNDNVKPALRPVANTAIVSNAITLWSIEYRSGFDPTAYDALVAKAGGQVLAGTDSTQFAGLVDKGGKAIATQQYEANYLSSVGDGTPVHVELTLGGKTSSADVLAGRGVYEGGDALRPAVSTGTSTLLPFADNPLALGAALLLTLVAVALAAYSLTSFFLKEDLSAVLQPYADAYSLLDGENAAPSGITKNVLIKRAVEITEQVAENQGMLIRAEGALERANLPLRAGEALFIYMLIVLVCTLGSLMLTRNIVFGALVGIVSALLPPTIVNFLGSKRRKKFMAQLPDTLSLLSGTLRAGYSLMQGVEAVSREVDEPMGQELRRVVTESRLGRPLEEALDASAERMDSPDFAWAVMAIRIQREVGGNLAELLLTVADTMVARERLRRDVNSLTAEGRVSAFVLAGMPPTLGVVMFVLNNEYVSKLFTDGLGIGMLVTACISMGIGFLWMKKIINIEI